MARTEIAVLTVTKRTGWEQIAIESLDRQKEFSGKTRLKWIIVTEEPNPKLEAFVELCRPSKITPLVIQAPPKKPGYPSNLNASLNAGLRAIPKTIHRVLFYQDFIELEPGVIARLIKKSKELGQNAFITTATHENGKFDARYTGVNRLRAIEPKEWEANVALAPLGIVRQLGGFDEEYDKGWSWDNVNLAERAYLLGADFYIDETVKPNLHFHEKERSIPPNGEFHEQRMREIRHQHRPIKLAYM